MERLTGELERLLAPNDGSTLTWHEMREMLLGLRQQLGQLEIKRRQIDEAVIEFRRRISGLGGTTSWRPVAAESYQEMQEARRRARSINEG